MYLETFYSLLSHFECCSIIHKYFCVMIIVVEGILSTRGKSLKPLSHKTMKSTRLYTKLGFFTPCRLRGGLCRLHDKTGTLPGTSYSLRDKPCSLHVRAEIFWLFKNFHELHMKFDLDIHHVNFMLTSCTLRGILVDIVLLRVHFISKFKHEVNVKPTRRTMKYREANK